MLPKVTLLFICYLREEGCMDIGERLKKLRIERNLTQYEIEELTGIKRSTIALYESGIRKPPVDKLIQLAFLYNVTLDYICGIDNRTIKIKSNESKV